MNQSKNSAHNDVVVIGIDWADSLHAWHCIGPELKQTAGTLVQDPAAIEQIIATWKKSHPGAVLAIAIEQAKGPLINALLKYDGLEIYPVNPAALASYRKSFRHGGGKNDETDALLLARFLHNYRELMSPLRPDDPITQELADLAMDRRKMVQQRVRMANQLPNATCHKCHLRIDMSPLYRHFGREMTLTWGANNGLGGRLINGAVSRDTAGDIWVRWQQHMRTLGVPSPVKKGDVASVRQMPDGSKTHSVSDSARCAAVAVPEMLDDRLLRSASDETGGLSRQRPRHPV